MRSVVICEVDVAGGWAGDGTAIKKQRRTREPIDSRQREAKFIERSEGVSEEAELIAPPRKCLSEV
jgi:hypothetical protein